MKIKITDETKQKVEAKREALREMEIGILQEALDVPTKHDRIVLLELVKIIAKAGDQIEQLVREVT